MATEVVEIKANQYPLLEEAIIEILINITNNKITNNTIKIVITRDKINYQA